MKDFKTPLIILLCIVGLASCRARKANITKMSGGPSKVALSISTENSYGYTEKDPICVGNESTMGGPQDESSYLKSLRGPNGEEINYSREGSCCPFKSKNGLIGGTGMLDIYSITYAGEKKPITLYINMYDAGDLQAPVGFTLKK